MAGSEETLSRLRSAAGRARELFQTQFDRPWMAKIMDEMPVIAESIKEVRNFLFRTEPWRGGELSDLSAGVEALEEFISALKRYLLPVLRERLGLSGFDPHYSLKNRPNLVLEGMVAYTFPHNLDRLEDLTAELRTIVMELGGKPARLRQNTTNDSTTAE